jgi:hypothetical protein
MLTLVILWVGSQTNNHIYKLVMTIKKNQENLKFHSPASKIVISFFLVNNSLPLMNIQ